MEKSTQTSLTIKYQKKVIYIYIYIYICLSVVFLDSSFRMGKNFNLQVFLEECKCVIKDKKITSILLMM